MAAITIAAVTIPNWRGPTTGVTIRFFVDQSFVASDGTLIQAGAVLNNTFYESYACTVSGSNITFPSSGSLVLDSTTDGQDRTTSLYSAYFFDSGGSLICPYDGFVGFRVPSTPTSTTWAALKVYNSPIAPIPIDLTTLSATQIAALIAQAINDMVGGSMGILSLGGGGTGANLTAGAGVFTKTNSGDSAVTIKALADFELLVSKGIANGYCPLNASARVALSTGGTNADLSATGPGFLKQASLGSVVTVGTLAANDVPNLQALNGLLTPDKGGTGSGSTPTANSVPNGNGTIYTPTTTPTIDGVTTKAQAAVTFDPYGAAAGNTGEARWKELAANGSSYTFFKAPDSIGSSFGYVLPSSQGAASSMLTNDGNGNLSWTMAPGAGSGYNTIQEEGVSLTQRTTLDFIGAALTAADTGAKTTLTLSQSPAGSTSVVGTGRLLAVSGGPLTIGGGASADLSADRTIAITTSPASAGTVVGTGRLLAVSGGPLTIGGGASADLSADRTIAVSVSPAASPTLVGTGRALTSSDGTITGVGDLSADRDLAVAANKTKQRVGVRNNAGTTVGTRANIKFADTATITATVTDSGGGFDDGATDQVVVSLDVATSSANHNLLSATHSDTVAASPPTRGDLIVANDGPLWARKAIGAANTVLRTDGIDPLWAKLALATDVSGQLAIANGGHAGATALAGFNNLSPLTTAADLLTHDGTNNIRLAKGNAGQMLRVNLAGTALEYADAAGGGTVSSVTINSASPGADTDYASIANPASAPVISFTANPNCNANTEAAFVLPGSLPLQGSFAAAGFGTTTINVARVFIPVKISFNKLSFAVSSSTSFNASVAIYDTTGTSRLVYSGVIAVAGTGVKSSTTLTGAAVSGGVATLPMGYYVYGWTSSATMTAAALAITTSASLNTLLNTGGSVAAIAGNPFMQAFAGTSGAGTGAMPSSLGSITALPTSTANLLFLLTKLYSV